MSSFEGSEISTIEQEKLKNIEKQIVELQESVVSLSDSIRDTQRYLIRLAQNQAMTAKQVAQWPYVVVDDSVNKLNSSATKKKPKKQDDDYGLN